ncbi:MAG: hypothetical protein GY720_06435 [bacterium]|nr:hypothetical protein [bacterium]
MQPPIPDALLARAAQWEDLTRWERAEVGRALRGFGWSFPEIRALIPVPKSTLSGWCSTVELSPAQIKAIRARAVSQLGVPRDTQWKRRNEIQSIRADAAAGVRGLIREPLWVAGTTLYWAEGAKTSNRLSLANSDPRALRLFVEWVRVYLDGDAEFVLKLNLHHGNDEPGARSFWASQLDLGDVRFYKTFIKPEGTGHRKNHLAHGVCAVIVRRSTDAFHRTMGWIDALPGFLTRSDC